jgi:hypothetical protein
MRSKTKSKPGNGRRRSASAKSFHQRYDEAEQRRLEVLARLESLNDKARAHPAVKRAQTLLNPVFRKAPVAQRPSVVSSAEWLLDLVERISILA